MGINVSSTKYNRGEKKTEAQLITDAHNARPSSKSIGGVMHDHVRANDLDFRVQQIEPLEYNKGLKNAKWNKTSPLDGVKCPEGVDKEECCPEGELEDSDELTQETSPVEEIREHLVLEAEENLRHLLSPMTKAGLVGYALDNFDYELDATKLKAALVEEIVELAK